MRILHYTLGLPPLRCGGLTKYTSDLMSAQCANGDVVSLLYPGDLTFWKIPNVKIIETGKYNGVTIYEIKNPTIVTLQNGVRKPSDIFRPKKRLSIHLLEKFFIETKPDVFHIHTFMGLPQELVAYLKEKGTKIVFTSHDYYGICLRTNFINQDSISCDSPGGMQCALCNKNAPGSLFLRLRNSNYLLKHKALLSSKSTQKKVRETVLNPNEVDLKQEQIEEYITLIDYYKNLFELIDCFYFNSSVSQDVYKNHIKIKQSVI